MRCPVGSLRHRAVGTEVRDLNPQFQFCHYLILRPWVKQLTSLPLSFGLENARYLPDQSCYDYAIPILMSSLPTPSLIFILLLEPFSPQEEAQGNKLQERRFFINAGRKSRDYESRRVTTNKVQFQQSGVYPNQSEVDGIQLERILSTYSG